jgi:hypothetical protein
MKILSGLLVAALLIVSVTIIYQAYNYKYADDQRQYASAPTAFIEMGTGRCVTTYEPSNRSIHACLPVLPESTRKVSVSASTEPTDIGANIDMYLDAPSM